MKIGRFAKYNNLSIDSIRHYMNLGLIIPQKQGGQYEFDERCKKDLDDILTFKGMGFTLNEIKSIFFFKRLGKLTSYQENEYYRDFFINKHNKITAQIEELKGIRAKLEDRIKEMESKKSYKRLKLGIDIKALTLFRCPKCGSDMVLSDGLISSNQVMNGKLECSCGEKYMIDDGILLVKQNTEDGEFNYDIAEYIVSTDPEYLDNVCNNMEWIYKRLSFNQFKEKILIELGSGLGFFLRLIYGDLPDDCIYIAIDHDLRIHRALKEMLERSGIRKNIIFICSDFLEIPICNASVDVVLDLSGTSNYSFEHSEFLLKLVDRYVKRSAVLIGSYILFKNFSSKSKISAAYRKNFVVNNVKEEIKSLGYKVTDERISEFVEHGGKYEDYFKENEKVFTYIFIGER